MRGASRECSVAARETMRQSIKLGLTALVVLQSNVVLAKFIEKICLDGV